MERARPDHPILTAREAGLVSCKRCARVWPIATERCGRCGSKLASRVPYSLARVSLWLAAGIAAYIPANLFPILRSRRLFFTDEVTILGSIVELFQSGAFGLAAIILTASVVIPIAKFAAIGALALSVGRRHALSPARRHLLYEAVELIGRWSMIDVFVVALLAALVRLSVLAEIVPGPASFAFALSVLCTMMAARAFDPRLLWDRPEPKKS